MRRHKIDILEHNTGYDSYGEPTDEWTSFRSGVWAKKEDIIGKEFYSALTSDNKIEKKFSTGFIKGVKSEMRIKYNEDIYEIIGNPVNIGDKNMELLFYCKMVK